MKKLVLALLCAGGISTMSGQVGEPRFTIGSKFGFGHSYIMPYSNVGFYPSWLAGLTTNYRFAEHWALGIDALYSSEGAKFKSGDATARVDVDYLRVPVTAQYLFGATGNDFRPRITAGPSFGVLMAEGTGYRDMDFGLNLGAGFSYEMFEEFWLTVDADYYHGLMDMAKGEAEKERNGNIRLSLGLVFGI